MFVKMKINTDRKLCNILNRLSFFKIISLRIQRKNVLVLITNPTKLGTGSNSLFYQHLDQDPSNFVEEKIPEVFLHVRGIRMKK